MLEFSKRLGLCLGIAAAFCLGACDDDSGSDKGKTNSGSDATTAECTSDDDCKNVDGKPVCDKEKKECVEKKDDEGSGDGKCKADSDCTDAAKPKCDTATGECKAEESGGEYTLTCPEGQKMCGTTCRDTTKETEHCGDCDKACTDGKQCVNSVCEFICEGDAPDKCDTGCTNLRKDVLNCGSCGKKCEDGEACNDGVCGLQCDEGKTPCGTECIILGDENNCSACGDACKDGTSCQGGTCKKSCDAGQEQCDDGKCYNLDSDDSCGSCGNTAKCEVSKNLHCSPNRTCEIACPDADGKLEFVNLLTDPKHCGACTGEKTVCGEKEFCKEGKCVESCEDDELEYEGSCIKKNDPTHCGLGSREDGVPEGGIDCTNLTGVVEATCENNKCKISKCADNYAVCESDTTVCTDLTKPEHCGSCTQTCTDQNADPDKTTCKIDSEDLSKSICHFECKEGMTSCDGKCKNLDADDANCGWCGNSCTNGTKCINGYCSVEKCGDDGYISITVNDQEIKAYCIETEAQFRDMRDNVNSGKKYPDSNNRFNAYILISNLVFGDETSWVPVGTTSNPFKNGYFLGNGKLITGNLTTNGGYVGLFGTVDGSVLEGINLKVSLTANGTQISRIGALAGNVKGNSIVRFCENKDFTVKDPQNADSANAEEMGGLIGELTNSTLSYCRVINGNVIMHGGGEVGGMLGSAGGSTVEYAEANVTVTTDNPGRSWDAVGALVGYDAGVAKILHSKTTGKIDFSNMTANNTAIGSFIGFLNASSEVTDCESTVEIIGKNNVGGIIGYLGGYINANQVVTLQNTKYNGKISCVSNCGGLMGGYRLTTGKLIIKDSTAKGEIKATGSSVGGLAGRMIGEVLNSHFSGKVFGLNETGGAIGYATKSTLNNVSAEGEVEGIGEASVHTGGLVGQFDTSTATNVWTNNKVQGYSEVGALIGRTTSTVTIDQCVSFGNATALTYGTKTGGMVGGLIAAGCGFTISNCAALGNINGDTGEGVAFGAMCGTNNMRNIYSSGKITKNGSQSGAFIGRIDSGTAAHVKNSYYWENAHDKTIGSGTMTTSQLYAFKYNDDNEAVLSTNVDRKLVSSLGTDNWISATCDLKNGPAKVVTIPIPKNLGADICK